MASRGSGDHPVTRGYELAGFLCRSPQFAPDVAGFQVKGQQTIGVIAFQDLQPRLQGTLLAALREQGDAFGDFADRYNAYEQALAPQGVHGTADTGVAAGPAQFGEHTGIE